MHATVCADAGSILEMSACGVVEASKQSNAA